MLQHAVTLLPQEYLRWETASLLPSAGVVLGNGTGFPWLGLAGASQGLGRAGGPPPPSNWAGGDALRGIGKLLNCSWGDIPVALIQQALANFFSVAVSLWLLKPRINEEFPLVGSAKGRKPLLPLPTLQCAFPWQHVPGFIPERRR